MTFINRLYYAEHKIFCICIEVYKMNDNDNFGKIYETPSNLKKWEVKNKLS